MTLALSEPDRRPAGQQGNALVIGAMLLALVLVAASFLSGGPAPLRRSAIGFEGLIAWLKYNGLEARGFGGGGLLTDENTGLRILPLFHTGASHRPDLAQPGQAAPGPRPEEIISVEVIGEKIALLPTLVILPKWSTAILGRGLAHPMLLLPRDDISGLLQSVDSSAGTVERRDRGYVEIGVAFGQDNYVAGLYYPQTIRAGACVPILGDREAMLLGKCDAGGAPYYLLADPDLMNAHGLRLAENARIAVAVIAALAEERPAIVDRTTMVFAAKPLDRKIRERTWADLARFFAYPLSLLWAGFAVICILVLWRAWVRYGPTLRPFEDTLGASKVVSIAATARLLRTAGHDAKLLGTYVATRCQTLAAELLGPHRPAGADPRALVAAAARRKSPELAHAFEAITREIDHLDPATAPADLLDLLDRFEGLHQRTLHEFGRTTGPRRRDPH